MVLSAKTELPARSERCLNRLDVLWGQATKLWQDPLAGNSAALYLVQGSRKLFPLFTVPYLTRVLNPTGWGTVVFVMSMGDLLSLIVEFGFGLSATREISRARHDRTKCRDVMSGVLGAQIILILIAAFLAEIAGRYIPLLHNHPQMVMAGLIYAVAQGSTPLWFFQGLERLRLAAALEIGAKFTALCGVFLLVKSPADITKVVVLQAMAAGFSATAGIGMAIRSFGFRFPSVELVKDTLYRGWHMFVFRSAESLYGLGNVFLLGLFMPPAIVGYFATAEKISKATFGLLSPIRDAVYPRLAYLAASSEEAAARLARPMIALMVAGGLSLTGTLFFTAPLVIRLLAGPSFAPAVPVLRLYSILPFVLSITYSVGLQWLLPLGRDRLVNRIIIAGGCVNLALSCILAPRFGAIGMAISVLSSELFVCANMIRAVLRNTNLWPARVAAGLPDEPKRGTERAWLNFIPAWLRQRRELSDEQNP